MTFGTKYKLSVLNPSIQSLPKPYHIKYDEQGNVINDFEKEESEEKKNGTNNQRKTGVSKSKGKSKKRNS